MKNRKVRDRNDKELSKFLSGQMEPVTVVEDPFSPQFGPSPELRAGTQQSQQNNSTQQENSRTPGAVKYSCETCGRKFSKKPYANAHCKPKSLWKCDNCGIEIK